MSMVVDVNYLSSFDDPVLTDVVGSMEDNFVVQDGDDGSVHVGGRWERVRRQWTVSWGQEGEDTIENLFEIQKHDRGFLFIPPRLRDYAATGDLGTGDGSTAAFQLKRTVTSGARSFSYAIKYPLNDLMTPVRDDAAVIQVFVDDVLNTDWTLGSLGMITFDSAPADGAAVTASFQFATPVRWVSERLDISLRTKNVTEIRSAVLEELFL